MKIVNEACIVLIKNIIKKYSCSPGYYCNTFNYVSSEETNSLDAMFLPNVILWDPLNHIKPTQSLRCPHCFVDKNEIVLLTETLQWTDGQTNSLIPRKIWDKDWFCLLVGRIYSCANHHRIVSYHAGILSQLPSCEIPFMLTHDSGLTINLFDFIMRMVECGTSFQSIQNVIRDGVLDVYMRRKVKPCSNFPLEQDTYEVLSASVHTIINCVTSHFRLYKQSYQEHFSGINFTSLSLDHTYKVATNIGYFQLGKWIKLYDSLFIALNENGLVKAYQFTKGSSFEQLDGLFQSLAGKNLTPDFLFVDNCCNVKNQLNSIFPGVAIKLDLFHAVQRLTKHMSNKHPFFFDAVKEIGLIFRESTDIGKERTKATTSHEEMLANLLRFEMKWRGVAFNGWKIVNEKVEDEFRKIKVHILNGCLSGIPVGMGTNKNEALHKSLKQFGRNRLSVETAEAIIANVLYATNSKRNGVKLAPPIWSQYAPPKSVNVINLPHSKNAEATEFHQSSSSSSGKEPLITVEPSDHCYYQQSEFSKILGLASTLSGINSSIPKDLTEKLFRYQGFTTLAAEFWNIDQFIEKGRQNEPFSTELIQFVGEKMGFEMTQTDGNFFSTFLLVLENVLQAGVKLPTELRNFIESIVNSEESISELKTCFVNEFGGHRKDTLIYKSFDKNEIADTNNYESSEFISQLFTAAANIFNLPIIIVPVACGLPMLPVFPVDQMVNHPIFMVFDPIRNTFNAYLTTVIKKTANEINVCYCGQKKNTNSSKPNCFQNFRCTCIKNKVSCSSLCKCKCCGNNKMATTSQPVAKRRKRMPHILSEMENTTSLQYLLNCDIPLVDNPPISSFHHFLLEATLYFLMKEMKIYSLLDIDISLLVNEMNTKYVNLCDDAKIQAGYDVELFRSSQPLTNASIGTWLKLRKKKSLLMIELARSSNSN